MKISRPLIGTKDGQYGSRIPAVWIGPGGLNHISCALGDNWNYYFTPKTKYNTGRWVNLKISQVNGVYEVRIDDNLIHTANNAEAQIWRNVKVVIGNTYDNYAFKSSAGEYRKFEIRSSPSSTSSVCKFRLSFV